MVKENNMVLNRLDAYISIRNMSYDRLAAAVGVTPATLRNYAAGLTAPPVPTAERIVRALHLSSIRVIWPKGGA